MTSEHNIIPEEYSFLVTHPSESLGTEFKQWIDLTTDEHKAKIVKGVIAFYNNKGVNKTLAYPHFGERDGLFKKALEAVFEDRFSLLDRLPLDVYKLFDLWTKRFASDTTFLRMLTQY